MDIQAVSNQGNQAVSPPETTPVRGVLPLQVVQPQHRESKPIDPMAAPQDHAPPAETPYDDREPAREEIVATTEGMNALLQANGSHIKFIMHEKAKQMMVEVIDEKTEEVIRTYPAKELLDLAAKIGEMVGALLDKRT